MKKIFTLSLSLALVSLSAMANPFKMNPVKTDERKIQKEEERIRKDEKRLHHDQNMMKKEEEKLRRDEQRKAK